MIEQFKNKESVSYL